VVGVFGERRAQVLHGALERAPPEVLARTRDTELDVVHQ
jgi:hypothetical protein